MGCPRPFQGSPPPTAPGHNLSQRLIDLTKRSVQDSGLSDPSHGVQRPTGKEWGLVICILFTWPLRPSHPRTPLNSWPPGGARGKGLAGHSASKRSLSSFLADCNGGIVTLTPPPLHPRFHFSESKLRLLEAGLLSRIPHLPPSAPDFPSSWCGIPAQ